MKFRTGIVMPVAAVCSALLIAGCVSKPRLSDNQLLLDYHFGSREFSSEEQERLKGILARKEQERQSSASTNVQTSKPSVATASSSDFPPVPPDSRADCEGAANTPFIRWIQTVQTKAGSGGACLNSRGAELINREGARRSRYCAHILSGTARAQSQQQAIEHDRAADQARASAAATCS
jgi:hypothetical protein